MQYKIPFLDATIWSFLEMVWRDKRWKYGDFRESEISKIFDNTDFGYTKITVERPLIGEDGKPVLKKGKPEADSSLRDALLNTLSGNHRLVYGTEGFLHIDRKSAEESADELSHLGFNRLEHD